MENVESHAGHEPATEKDTADRLIEWMKLQDVPTAELLDPDGKVGLRDAFREADGRRPDPIPKTLVEQAKREVQTPYNSQTIFLPLLQESVIPVGEGANGAVRVLPLFREQVLATVQYLTRLGVEAPRPIGDRGEGFVLVRKPEDDLLGGVSVQTRSLPTNSIDPIVRVIVERTEPTEESPVKRISLSISKPWHQRV